MEKVWCTIISAMIAPFDVFALRNGSVDRKWLGCTDTLAQAFDLLRKNGVGIYLVFSRTTQHKNQYEVTLAGVIRSISAQTD